jgi:hypothetical protein
MTGMSEPPKRSVRAFAICGLIVGVIAGVILGAPIYPNKPDGTPHGSSMLLCGTVYGLFGAFLGGALARAADRQDAIKRAKANTSPSDQNTP